MHMMHMLKIYYNIPYIFFFSQGFKGFKDSTVKTLKTTVIIIHFKKAEFLNRWLCLRQKIHLTFIIKQVVSNIW